MVDDHPLFINGLRQYLAELEPSVAITEASTAAQAWTLLAEHPDHYDFIFLDIQLPDAGGIELLEAFKARNIRAPILVISAREEPAWIHNALSAGAAGFLSKASPRLELKEALTALRANTHYVSSHLLRPLDDYRAGLGGDINGKIRLTRRQRSVIELIAKGYNNQQISHELGISESTVKGHISTLFDLLDVQNRTSCLHQARKYGLLA